MKISESTIAILKNFSLIAKNGLLLRPGNLQTIVSNDKTIVAEAKVTEDFPVQFGIYNLTEFISNIDLFSDVGVEFDENKVVMQKDGFKIVYRASSPILILGRDAIPLETIREKIKIENPDAQFLVKNEDLQKIIKVAKMNTLPHISFIGNDGKLSIRGFEKNNVDTNEVVLQIGETDKTFESVFLTQHLDKLVQQDYNVSINSKGRARFDNKDNTLNYTVALQV